MSILRVHIVVDQGWTARLTWTGSDGDERSRERALGSTDTDAEGQPRGFPLPPAGEVLDEAVALLCQEGEAALGPCRDRILARRPDEGDVEAFGRYLFQTLVGDATWAEIRADAAGSVDLAVTVPSAAPALHRLNWEMMRGPDGFLARGAPIATSITRVVGGAGAPARVVGSPPRLLFVVGSSLSDPRIRPGAEYMGLLRRVDEDGRVLSARILESATPERVRRAVERHRPEVVYFVCHGGEDRGRPYLEFQTEAGEADPAAALQYAPQLLDMLRAPDGTLPALVVLAACGSGAGTDPSRVLGAHATAPLAASLVDGGGGEGVPVVVAMAGDISDRACRHFTRRFGQMLVRGEPLLAAGEMGRRAAFVDPAAPPSGADWALPAVFTSEAVEADFRPVAPDDDATRRMGRRIGSFGLLTTPVFCGRQRFLDLYDELFDPRRAAVLCLYSVRDTPKAGKSRILHEFVGQAVRDGRCPVLVGDASPGSSLRFAGATDLALEVLASVARTREIFGLKPPLDSALLRTVLLRAPIPNEDQLDQAMAAVPDALFAEKLAHARGAAASPAHPDGVALDPNTVRELLRADLLALADEAAAEAGTGEGEPPLVLFDHVQGYDKGIAALLMSDQAGAPGARPLLGPDGLGSVDRRIPVVVAFSLGTAADELLRPVVEHHGLGQRIRVEAVGGFAEGEDALAFQRVLLHPFQLDLVPGASDVALAPSPSLTPAQRQDLMESLRIGTQQALPGQLGQLAFYAVAKMAKSQRILEEADDEARLRRLIEDQQGGG
jgi:hypothetical protein